MDYVLFIKIRALILRLFGFILLCSASLMLTWCGDDENSNSSIANTTQTTNTTGAATTQSSNSMDISDYFENWETGDEKNHPWYFGGHAAPEVVEANDSTNDTKDGSAFCLRFGNVNQDQYSQFGFTIHVTEASWVSFQYKVETDTTDGFFVLYTGESFTGAYPPDDPFAAPVVTPEEKFFVSGITGWEEKSVNLSVGTYDIAWRFEKTGTDSMGQDTAWVDNIHFGPAVETLEPQPILGLFLDIQGSYILIGDTQLELEKKQIVLVSGDVLDYDQYYGLYMSTTSRKEAQGSFYNVSLFAMTHDLERDFERTIDYGNSSESEIQFFGVIPGFVSLIINRTEPGDRRNVSITVPYNSYQDEPFKINVEWNPAWESEAPDPIPTVENLYQDNILWELPDTGQTTSYNSGDDATYGSSEKNNYADNQDGSITDTITNLMWEKKSSATEMTWAEALTHCDTLTTASHEDWRMPTSAELTSIVDYGKPTSPSINETFFTYTASGYGMYWTATTYLKESYQAWVIFFIDGLVQWASKTSMGYVRCVR